MHAFKKEKKKQVFFLFKDTWKQKIFQQTDEIYLADVTDHYIP